VAPLGEIQGGGDFERQELIWRAIPLGSAKDMYRKALETVLSLHRGPVGGTWRRGSFTGHFERKVRFYFYQETSFTRNSERYVKEGFGNGHLSP
jgi:hypothetical protein